MLKKLLALAATAVGAVVIQKKLRDQKAEQDLWAEATDDVRSTSG
ncbi:MAG: DLW-39 family protein [Actinomycetota bacterium]|nr:DLW-39 family protein [Actinomycetota bacterium]